MLAKNCRRHVTWILLCIAIAACDGPFGQDAAPDYVRGETIKEHVTVLASDGFEGRKMGTPGYDAAATYVAEQFQNAGLEPVGAEGRYFQPIIFKEMRLIEDSAQLILRTPEKAYALVYGTDFTYRINPSVGRLNTRAQTAFVGYGISAPSRKIDSYAGLDVTGKIVVALDGAPPGLDPEDSAILSALDHKVAAATRAGAIGLIIIPSIVQDDAPSDSLQPPPQPSITTWRAADGQIFSRYGSLKSVILLSADASAKLFQGAAQRYQDILAAVTNGENPGSFDLSANLTALYLLEERFFKSANVLARLPANTLPQPSETKQQAEAIMLLAHLDHLGRGAAVDGDDIYNGAVDNALGVAALIEVAKALSSASGKRGRDIYFAALTGEEAGLLGAEYLAAHLPMAGETLKAVLNIDMPVALYPLASLYAAGQSQSSLGAFADQIAKRYDLRLDSDTGSEADTFLRSDHYAFAKRGIPALYLNIGVMTSPGSQDNAQDLRKAFFEKHYHQPSDDMDLPINWQAAARFADVHVEMLRALADPDLVATWNANSLFKPSPD